VFVNDLFVPDDDVVGPVDLPAFGPWTEREHRAAVTMVSCPVQDTPFDRWRARRADRRRPKIGCRRRAESDAGYTHRNYGHDAVTTASIYPLMPSSVLDNTVSRMKIHFGAVSHDQGNVTRDHDDIIDRVR